MVKILVVLLIGIAILLLVPPPQCNNGYFFENGYNPDAFEYFMPAANFALHNRFPYYGFMSNMNSYHIHPAPESVKYFADTYKAGSMVFVSKPPLYSLILGTCFKLFGFGVCTSVYLNYALLIVILISMLFAAFLMGKLNGFLLLAPIALVYAKSFLHDVWNTDAEMLTAALTIVSCLVSIWAFKNYNRWQITLAGGCMAFLLLCKGYFVFTALFVLIFLMWRFIKSKNLKYLQALFFFSLGFGFPLVCWMAYINPLLKKDIPNRLAFAEKLISTASNTKVHTRSEIFDKNGNIREDLKDAFLKLHQYEYAIDNRFVIVSNQFGRYNILDVHNEYCTDGDFHPEWRFIETSFYNTDTAKDVSNIERLIRFYRKFPTQLLSVSIAKLFNVWGYACLMLFLAILVYSIIYILNTRTFIPWPAFYIITSVLVLIAVYGDIRYVNVVLPIALSSLACNVTNILRFLWFKI